MIRRHAMGTKKLSIVLSCQSELKSVVRNSTSHSPLVHSSFRSNNYLRRDACFPHSAIISCGDSPTIAKWFSTQLERRNDDELTPPVRSTARKSYLSTREEKTRKTSELLNSIPIGKMTLHDDLRQVRYLIHYWGNMRTNIGAQKAEDLLERVVAEHRDGRNRSAYVNAATYNFVIDSWSKSGNPIRAQSLLDRMEERYSYAIEESIDFERSEEHTALYPQPSIEGYNSILHAWSLSDRPEAISEAEEIIAHLKGKRDNASLPNTRTYNILMNAYANQTGEYGFAQKAEDVLLEMSELNKNGSTDINPDTLSFNTVLKAWKNSGGGIETAKRSEDILRLMVKLYSEGHDNVRPDSISWCTVLSAYGQHFQDYNTESGNMAIDHAQSLLEFFMEYSHGLPDFKGMAPSIISTLFECILNSSLPNASERARRLIDRMIRNEFSCRCFDDPNLITYFVRIFCESKDEEIALKAYDMMQNMINEEIKVKPNTSSFNNVLRMLGRFRKEKEAEYLYRTMKDLAHDDGCDTLPDIVTFNTMANIYFRSERDDSCEKLSDIVQDLEEANELEGLKSFDTFSHSVLINKMSRSKNLCSAERAFEVLMKMEEHYLNGHKNCVCPSTLMYNMVLAMIAREGTKDAGKKAMQIIQYMEKLSEEGNSSAIPNTYSYTSGINAWAKSGSIDSGKNVMNILGKIESLDADVNSTVQIDTIVYESALGAFQRGAKEDGQMAENVFERMVALHQDGNKLVQPSELSCNLALKAHCMTSKQSGCVRGLLKVHAMLLRLVHRYRLKQIDFIPSRVGFNTVISAWASSRHSVAGSKAQELCYIMKDLGKKGMKDMGPDQYTNSSILTLLSKSRKYDGARKAQRFFDKLDPDSVDVFTYNCLLSAWAKSKENKKVRVAHKILKEMVQRGKVDRISYNIFLNACAFSRRSDAINKETFAIALKEFEELALSYTPDDVSIKTIVIVCKHLSASKEEHDQNLKKLFEVCCKNGVVGGRLIQELKKSFTGNKCEEVLGHSLEGELANEWIRKIKSK